MLWIFCLNSTMFRWNDNTGEGNEDLQIQFKFHYVQMEPVDNLAKKIREFAFKFHYVQMELELLNHYQQSPGLKKFKFHYVQMEQGIKDKER